MERNVEINIEEIEKRLLILPPQLLDAYESTATANAIFQIGKTNGISIDVIGRIAEETGYIMLGLVAADKFIRNLTEITGNAEKAKKIATEINARIFLPIREALRKMHDGKWPEQGVVLEAMGSVERIADGGKGVTSGERTTMMPQPVAKPITSLPAAAPPTPQITKQPAAQTPKPIADFPPQPKKPEPLIIKPLGRQPVVSEILGIRKQETRSSQQPTRDERIADNVKGVVSGERMTMTPAVKPVAPAPTATPQVPPSLKPMAPPPAGEQPPFSPKPFPATQIPLSPRPPVAEQSQREALGVRNQASGINQQRAAPMISKSDLEKEIERMKQRMAGGQPTQDRRDQSGEGGESDKNAGSSRLGWNSIKTSPTNLPITPQPAAKPFIPPQPPRPVSPPPAGGPASPPPPQKPGEDPYRESVG